MARRKQRCPRHFETATELATFLQNGISSNSESEEDEHVCGKCRAEFPSLSEFLQHKKECVNKRPVLLCIDVPNDSDENCSYSENSDVYSLGPENALLKNASDATERDVNIMKFNALPFWPQPISDSNVILEELHNTRVAVAQHGRSLQGPHLAALLSNMHQQQVAQLHFIQELQARILGSPEHQKILPLLGTAALTPPQSFSDGAPGVTAPSSDQPSAPTSARTSTYAPVPVVQSVTNEEAPPREPNTLELLQRHTEQALQNTMSGGSFLLSRVDNSSDLSAHLRKSKSDDATLKHGCKFCGKVFGSDSALQIHLRSHTGERPFKCSVCGNCFSTRGNLKVHFQRHKERNEIPELSDDMKNIVKPNTSNTNSNLLPLVPTSISEQQNEQALDFTNTAEDKNTSNQPMNQNSHSRSLSPNDTSNCSFDSVDGSIEANGERYKDQKTDCDMFDDEDERASNSSAINDDDVGDLPLEDKIQGQPPFMSTPTFTSFFRPTSFSGAVSDSPVCLPPTTTTASSNSDNYPIHHDPTFYQNLLPRAGSTDNSWESLMEVTKTSETEKLQQMVDNIDHKVTDPNECAICHRVLSCKSALQMHYRTHTGERPFKCKICSRAFTTKGNLKTHMGVHRVKPPVRILHQCPVCHKQFANSVILQQHIRTHTTDPILQEQIFHMENKPLLLPPSYPRDLLLSTHLSITEPLALTNSETKRHPENLQNHRSGETVIKSTGNEVDTSHRNSPSPSASSSDSQTPLADENVSQEEKSPTQDATRSTPEDLTPKSAPLECTSPVSMVTSEHSKSPVRRSQSPVKNTSNSTLSNVIKAPTTMNNSQTFPLLTQESKDQIVSRIKTTVSNEMRSLMINLANDRPLPMTLPSDCPIPFSFHSDRLFPPVSIPTCTTAYTASLEALENHVKAINSNYSNALPFPPPFGLGLAAGSHFRPERNQLNREKSPSHSPSNLRNGSDTSTDERSTPGSQAKVESPNSGISAVPYRSESGALDLTPRTSNIQRSTADFLNFAPLAGLPFSSPLNRSGTTCQVCFKTFACQSALEIHYRSHTKERPFKCSICDRGFSTKGNMKQHMLTHKIKEFPPQLFAAHSQQSQPSPSSLASLSNSQTEQITPKKSPEDINNKRPQIDTSNSNDSSPVSKRAPGVPKHMCHVCHKPFSSGSALQIHMRTHTGDKPFQCPVCGRAFTTKGNLKVHMGTHMFTNSTSRRGRRMSLDLASISLPHGNPGEYPPPPPPPPPPTARRDPYFPYVPPLMNGISQQPPKMNAISVIQTAGVSSDSGSPLVTGSFTMAAPLSLVTAGRQTLASTPSTPRDTKTETGERRNLSSPEKNSNGKSPLLFDHSSQLHPVETSSADRGASWGWKIACKTCNKICSSSADLEMHVQNEHLNNELPKCSNSTLTESIPT